MAADADPALEALCWPFAQEQLSWPASGGALFMQARDGWPLHRQTIGELVCTQDFKPEFDALQRAGLAVDVEPESGKRWSLVLLLPPRQREQMRAMFARALAHVAPGGRVIACLPNNEGAKTGQADLARLVGPLQVLSKHKCRVFWSEPLHGAADSALASEWETLDAPRPIDVEVAGHRFASAPGVFAWDRIDPASALLAAHLPTDLSGEAADLGAGYGYLAAELLARCPNITSLDVYEAQAQALQLARRNLAAFEARTRIDYHWHDVTVGLPRCFDVIVSNPPFHAQGRAERPDIGRAFIKAAAQALNRGGRLWLVANRHLPYESVLDARFGRVRTVAQQGGFKVIEAIKA